MDDRRQPKVFSKKAKQRLSNIQPLDKEEAETDKSEHQTSVLDLISTTTVNGGRPKGLTLKNKKNLQDRMDEAKLYLNHKRRNCFHSCRQGQGRLWEYRPPLPPRLFGRQCVTP